MNARPLPALRPALRPVVAALAALLPALDAGAALPAALRDPSPIDLAVQVTRRGELVHGLGAADFRLRVDGREVAIDDLLEVVAGRASGASGSPVPQRYLVFVDDLFSVPVQRNRLLDQLAQQLDQLAPADRMAIVAFDGRRLAVLSDWSRSLIQLRGALAAAQRRPSYGLERLAEQRQEEATYRLFDPRGLPPGVNRFGGGRPLDAEPRLSQRRSRQLSAQLGSLASAASAAVEGLEAPPGGRRVLLFVAGSWPVSADFQLMLLDVGGGSAQKLFAPLVESADQRSYAIYPLRVPTFSSTGTRGAIGARTRLPADDPQARLLHHLAAETCGLALVDDLGRGALRRVIEDSGSYYRLRFTPAWRHDDRRRRLEVDVRQRGLRVRVRPGLADPSRHSRIARLVESARWLDKPPPGADALGVDVGRGADGDVVLTLRIRPEAVAAAAVLELRVAPLDEAQGWRPPLAVERLAPISLASRDGRLVHATRLSLRQPPPGFLVSLYDPVAGTLLARPVMVDH
ncbi:MAG: VWA domain-containing protein [Acidobacteria bacterium]|nr:MAG: VWA domain-containing protein [Acidobacteriota bacterium]